MKIVFGTTVLANISAAPKISAQINSAPARCVVQKTNLAFGDNPFTAPRGNVEGNFNFTTGCSYSTRELALAAVKTLRALCGTSATLYVYDPPSASTANMTMAGAILAAIDPQLTGTRLTVKYTFDITTLT